MVWTRRTLLMGLLVGFPVLAAAGYRVWLAARPAVPLPPAADLYAVAVAIYWIGTSCPSPPSSSRPPSWPTRSKAAR